MVSPGQSAIDKVSPAPEAVQMPSQILFLRIDSKTSTPNLYGKYDLVTVNMDIWVMGTGGGDAINLTKSSINAMSADWSPDKSKIVFDSTNNLLGGKPICSIYVMDADGSDVKRISPDGSSRHFPAWSPDDKKIVYSKYYPSRCAPDVCYPFSLFTFGPDGNEDKQVIFSGSASNHILPRWFPDSKHVAFLDNELGLTAIWSGDISTDGDLMKYNTSNNPIGYNSLYMTWFSLSPDATKIVYSHAFSQDYYRSNRELYIFDVTSGETTQLTKNDYADDNPCFSPDGKQILFSSFGATEKTTGMFIMDINGTNIKQIPSQYGDMPMKWR